MRLDKYLAHVGCGTRSEVQQLIKKKKVKVNDKVIIKPNFNVKEEDSVVLGGKELVIKEFYYFIMNKPAGVITANSDERHETVMDLLEKMDQNKPLSAVGRLDKDTEGLLILTSDGKFNHALMSPKKHINKTYYAEVEGELIEESVKLFEEGMELRDGTKFLPAKLEIVEKGEITKVYITISEGKYHQVKRMIARCGGRVSYLKRTAMGGLNLPEDIASGEYRELTQAEMELLKAD